MVLPVYTYGHPVLRKIAQDIDKDFPNLEKLISDMWQTMYETEGVGLAAPQIGKSIRLFVIDADPFKEVDPKTEGFKKVFINAKITDRSGEEWPMGEGCLSIPNLNEEVYRKDKVTIEYYDENFEFHTEDYDGYRARVIQHEYDHLEGKLFIDHLSLLRRKLLKGKLNQIAKGKVRSSYRTVSA